MRANLSIGVDVGGTKIAAALVDRDSETLRLLRTFTPQDSAGSIVSTIEGLIQDLLSSDEVAGTRPPIGIGVPAQVDFAAQKILFCTNLPLQGSDVAADLARRLGLPVVMDNDANLAALAETRFGAASGCTDAVCLTLGTGIGGGLILNGRLYRGSLGTGAELGHIVIERDGPECACGARGCLEALAAGPALARNARAAIRQHPESLLATLTGPDPDDVTGEIVTEAARKGDPVAIGLMEEVGNVLGRAMASLANVLNPQVFVIGGGMIEAGDLILEPARRTVSECAMQGVLPGLRIVQASLGNNAGYLGAATLAFEYFDEGS